MLAEYILAGTILKSALIYEEIMDPREFSWYFTNPAAFREDLKTFNERAKELHGAPPIRFADDLLPDYSTLRELLAFARASRHHCEVMRSIQTHRAAEWGASITRLNLIERELDLMCDAQCGFYYVHTRRLKLKELVAIWTDQ